MNITILGAGNMARGIGTRLVAGGNSLTLLSRDPQEGATLAAELHAVARNGATIQAAPFGSPLRDDVVRLVSRLMSSSPVMTQQQRPRSPNWSKRVACVRLTLGRSRVLANWKEWAFSALRSKARSAPNS